MILQVDGLETKNKNVWRIFEKKEEIISVCVGRGLAKKQQQTNKVKRGSGENITAGEGVGCPGFISSLSPPKDFKEIDLKESN